METKRNHIRIQYVKKYIQAHDKFIAFTCNCPMTHAVSLKTYWKASLSYNL